MISCSGLCLLGGLWGWKNTLLRFLLAAGTAGDGAGGTRGGGMLSPGVLRAAWSYSGGAPQHPLQPSSLRSAEPNPWWFRGRNGAKPYPRCSGSPAPVSPWRDTPNGGQGHPAALFYHRDHVCSRGGGGGHLGARWVPAGPSAGLVSHQLSGSQIR